MSRLEEGERYCTKCQWYEPNPQFAAMSSRQAAWAVCNNPKQGLDLVTGEQRKQPCSWHRSMVNYKLACGGSGVWWEPRVDPLDIPQAPAA